jgi:predicted RNA-binding protein with PIN domain
MIYLIDANNLAGKLNLLEQSNFDLKLVGFIKHLAESNKSEFVLVFDGRDLMGDKHKSGRVTVIYTPRDSYYKSADDKVIELMQIYQRERNDEIAVVTDDRAIQVFAEDKFGLNSKVKIISASDFAQMIIRKTSLPEPIDNEEELSNDDISEINNELIRQWQDK